MIRRRSPYQELCNWGCFLQSVSVFLAFVLFFVSVVVEDMCVKIFKESHTYQAAFFLFFAKTFSCNFLIVFLVSAFQRKSTRAVWGFGCRESVMQANEK
jgi:hypothetical protein